MRELPMMKQVKDSSVEMVLAFMFHDFTRLIRHAQIVQRVGEVSRVTLPGAWHCHSGQSEGLQEIAEQ